MFLVGVFTFSASADMLLLGWWVVLSSAFLAPDYNVNSGVYTLNGLVCKFSLQLRK